MIVRRETATDVPAVRAVVAVAFDRGDRREPPEAVLLDDLRTDPGWLPALSLVAVGPDDRVVGHVLCTRGHVGAAPVLALGPLAVHPDHQRRGVGSALVHAVLGAGDALGEPVVVLLGETAYYSRFGFRPAAAYGIDPPVPAWGEYFQARPFTAYTPDLRGPFAYPTPFARHDPAMNAGQTG